MIKLNIESGEIFNAESVTCSYVPTSLRKEWFVPLSACCFHRRKKSQRPMENYPRRLLLAPYLKYAYGKKILQN